MSESSRPVEQPEQPQNPETIPEAQTTHHEDRTILGGLKRVFERVKYTVQTERHQTQSDTDADEIPGRPTTLKDEWVIRGNGNKLARNARPAAVNDNLNRVYGFRDPNHPKPQFPPDSQPTVGNDAVRRSVDEALRRKGLLTDQAPQETAPMVDVGSPEFEKAMKDQDLSRIEKHRLKTAAKRFNKNSQKTKSRVKEVGVDRIKGYKPEEEVSEPEETDQQSAPTTTDNQSPRTEEQRQEQFDRDEAREQERQRRVEELAKFINNDENATEDVMGLIALTARRGGLSVTDLQRQLSHGRNKPTIPEVMPKADILKAAGIIENESQNGMWMSRITAQDYVDALDMIANGQVPSPEAENTDTESSQEQTDDQENQTTSEEAAAQPEQEAHDAESFETTEENIEYFDEETLEKVRTQLNEKITSAIDFLRQEQGKTLGGAEIEAIVAEERKNVFIDILSDEYGMNTLDPGYENAITEGVERLDTEFDKYVARRALGLYEESESIVRTMVNEDTSDKPISRKYQEARARVWYTVREGAPLAERDIIMETFDRMKAEDAQKRREKREQKAAKAAEKSAEQAVADNAARTAIES